MLKMASLVEQCLNQNEEEQAENEKLLQKAGAHLAKVQIEKIRSNKSQPGIIILRRSCIDRLEFRTYTVKEEKEQQQCRVASNENNGCRYSPALHFNGTQVSTAPNSASISCKNTYLGA